MNVDDMDHQVKQIIIRTFGLSDSEDGKNLRMESVPQWDSMGHMELVSALEDAFDVRFPAYALSELVDADAIVRTIQQLKG